MTEQPPIPPSNPSNQLSSQPAEGNPPTQPMPAAKPTQPLSAAESAPAVGPPVAPTPPDAPRGNLWHQATSTIRRRWAVALGAGVLAALVLFGIVVAGLAVVGHNDRISLAGDRKHGYSRGQDGEGNGQGNVQGNVQGPGANDKKDRRGGPGMPGMPGMLTARGHGPGGLGFLSGTVLHGEVTASANGSVQALVFQRGEVTAVSATSITLKSSDGFTGTYGLTAATSSKGAGSVKGGQAFVLARASDKVAIRATATPAEVGAAPSG